MKCSDVYRYDNGIFVLTSSESTGQFWFQEGSCTVLPCSIGDVEIGRCVREHLAKSRQGVKKELSRDDKVDDSAVVQASGARSWSAFVRKAKNVSVEESDVLSILPYEKSKAEAYFVPRGEDRITLALTVSDEELGACIRSSLE